MKLTVNKICKFTNSTASCRNLVEGKKVLQVGYLLRVEESAKIYRQLK